MRKSSSSAKPRIDPSSTIVEDIVRVDGLGMVNFGPNDLAMDLGLTVRCDLDTPPILAALEKLAATAAPLKIPVMCPAAPPTFERVRKMIKQGIKAITLPNHFASFNNVCRKCMDEIVTPHPRRDGNAH
jgi:2-keto-3-deoxy-L-rhamnonate aldolase RhmA